MKYLRRFHDLYREEADLNWLSDLRCLLPVVVFIILTGPLLFLVYGFQDWCAGSSWDAEDRWQGTRAFAIAFLLAYIPLILFRGDLAHLWPPVLGALVWHNPLLWWGWCVPLAPALAFLSERVDPRTKPLERILLPSELPPPPATSAGEKPSSVSKVRRKPSAKTDEKRSMTPGARQRKKARDPRPIYQAWAPPQLVLPQSSPRGGTPSSPASSARSARQAKKDERDEGESLQDIF